MQLLSAAEGSVGQSSATVRNPATPTADGEKSSGDYHQIIIIIRYWDFMVDQLKRHFLPMYPIYFTVDVYKYHRSITIYNTNNHGQGVSRANMQWWGWNPYPSQSTSRAVGVSTTYHSATWPPLPWMKRMATFWSCWVTTSTHTLLATTEPRSSAGLASSVHIGVWVGPALGWCLTAVLEFWQEWVGEWGCLVVNNSIISPKQQACDASVPINSESAHRNIQNILVPW